MRISRCALRFGSGDKRPQSLQMLLGRNRVLSSTGRRTCSPKRVLGSDVACLATVRDSGTTLAKSTRDISVKLRHEAGSKSRRGARQLRRSSRRPSRSRRAPSISIMPVADVRVPFLGELDRDSQNLPPDAGTTAPHPTHRTLTRRPLSARGDPATSPTATYYAGRRFLGRRIWSRHARFRRISNRPPTQPFPPRQLRPDAADPHDARP